MGLININDFLIAQQAMRFKRAHLSKRDNWRVDLTEFGSGNVFTVDNKLINAQKNPILKCSSESFSILHKKFTNRDCNYKQAFVYNNPAFLRCEDDISTLDTAFFTVNLLDTFAGTSQLPRFKTTTFVTIHTKRPSENERVLI